ncbi:MAG: hypothetical protein OXI33_08100 [Chloroflexota bacterium]|nr:hypothetical protein [Chloroflexota bacterium]
MSDGPWKSLPLRRHWKQFAKRVEIRAFSAEEVIEALDAALLKEARELPFKAIMRILAPNGQGTLFSPDLAGAIEALRQEHPGSKTAQTFLDYMSQQDASTSSGRDLVESAVADTLRECLHDNSRSTKEHYLRKTWLPWSRVSRRFTEACRAVDVQGLASRIVDDSGSPAPARSPVKRDGLDEGPQL